MQIDRLYTNVVHPIQIPTPFAVGDVFSYLITDEKIVLVDTGHFSDEAFEILKTELKNAGVSVRDIDEIWLTHGHPDHYGQAGRLADISGAEVFGHRLERSNFSANDNRALFEVFFKQHAIPQQYTALMLEQLDWLQQYQQPIQPQWISQDDQLSSGSLMAEVHLTPGHAPGHLAYVFDNGLIFSGDLLLAHISTNALINFDPDSGQRNKSLLQYRESLQWVRRQKGLVFPGHGQKIENTTKIADHHLKEQEKRYAKIQQLLEQQPLSLLEIAQYLFADAIKEGAIFLVLSEVMGYLDWGIEEEVIAFDKAQMSYQSI